MPVWLMDIGFQIALTIACAILAAALGFAKGKLRNVVVEKPKRQDSIEKGVKALLYDRLMQAYEFYSKRGWISPQDLKNMEHLYNAYAALDGNGTGKSVYEKMKKMPNREEDAK